MVLFGTVATFLSIALDVVLVILLLRGPFRQFPVLFTFASVHFLTGILELGLSYLVGPAATLYVNIYWIDEILVDVLLFLLVIVLIRVAAAGRPAGAAAGKILVLAVLAAAGLPFLFGHRAFIPASSPVRLNGRWFFTASQILNFGGAIMNLVLWGNLIGVKQRDPRMLTICAGLGIAITGEAIRYGLLALSTSPGLRQASNVLGTLTHTAGWVIWCWAFRPRSSEAMPTATSSGY